MAKRFNVSLPDSLVSKIESSGRKLSFSALLQAAIIKELEVSDPKDRLDALISELEVIRGAL